MLTGIDLHTGICQGDWELCAVRFDYGSIEGQLSGPVVKV